jgi:hypothetical protein
MCVQRNRVQLTMIPLRPNSPLWHLVSLLPWRLAVPFHAATARRRIAPWLGREPDFARPRAISERVAARMFRLWHPLASRLADKLALRALVAERIGAEHALPLLGHWERPRDIPWDALPDAFVVKCTHGSRLNLFVTDRDALDRRAAERRLARWLRRRHHRRYGEACYRGIRPRLLAEPWLGPPGQTAEDDKVHVFCGRARFLQHYRGRGFDGTAERINWHGRDMAWLGFTRHPDPTMCPDPAAGALFDLAERLVPDLVYARVDFFIVAGRPLVSEVTLAPGAGTFPSMLPEGDEAVGAVWAEEEARARAEGRFARLV